MALKIDKYYMIQDIKKYEKIEKLMRRTEINNFSNPQKFVPILMLSDYNRGIFIRYFAIKVNDNIITEIDKNQYDMLKNKMNRGIDYNLYKPISLKWKISGVKNDIYKGKMIIKHGVEDTNRRTVNRTAKKFPKIKGYFKNMLEFYLDIN